jgi:hypothetical protein
MLCLLAATLVAYKIPAKPVTFDVGVTFEGFIPILGGQEGTVAVTMGVDAGALEPDSDGLPQAVSEVKALKIVFNDAELPLGVEAIQAYFPKTTVTYSPEGKILKSNAPDKVLPVKLPGLDIKRFPDITYMPIEFPSDGIEVGKEWSYKKSFGGSDVAYAVTPISIEGNTVQLSLKVSQEFTVLEDDGLNVVTDEKLAYAKVKTVVSGGGKATFDLSEGLATYVLVEATADTEVSPLSGKTPSKRSLKTKLEIRRRTK